MKNVSTIHSCSPGPSSAGSSVILLYIGQQRRSAPALSEDQDVTNSDFSNLIFIKLDNKTANSKTLYKLYEVCTASCTIEIKYNLKQKVVNSLNDVQYHHIAFFCFLFMFLMFVLSLCQHHYDHVRLK